MRRTFTKNFLTLLIVIVGVSVTSAQSFQFRNMAPAKADAAMKKSIAVAINSVGEVFIADAVSKTIHVFDSTGTKVNIISSVVTETSTIAFSNPTSLCIDVHDNLYVYDEVLGKVLVIPVSGNGYAFGEKGSLAGQFDKVLGVAADSKGYIYLLNGGRKQVDVFSPGGDYLTWIAGAYNRAFTEPIALGMNGADELYVLDTEGTTVFMFDVTGNAVNTNRNLAAHPGVKISAPLGMAVFSNGDFFILDGTSNTTTQFDKLGTVQGTVGTKGPSAKGIFVQAGAISACGKNKLVILDSGSTLAQVFDVETKTSALQPTAKRMQLLKNQNTTQPAADIALASNGYRYIIPADNSENVIAYNASTLDEVFSLVGKFGDAVAVAADAESNLYVVDRKEREVFMYDAKGIFIRKFGKEIKEKLKEPTSIAIQSTGNIIIADRGNGSLLMWNSKGVFQSVITKSDKSVMLSPYKIRVDSKDRIYIWDDKQNVILRAGINGRPIATTGIQVRGEKIGGKEGVIGGFYLDPLDQVHVFNTSTSQLEIYEWDLEPKMKFSMGNHGAEANGFDNVDNILFDKESFRIYFLQNKTRSQKVYQFMVKPPTPENNLLFEVAEGKLQVRFNRLEMRAVESYGLVTADVSGKDSLVTQTNTSTLVLEKQQGDLAVKHYGLVSILKGDFSDPTKGFDDYFSYANQLVEAKRYDEALNAYQKALEQMGQTPSMAEFISRQLSNTGKTLAGNSELGRALQFLRVAFSLTPQDQETISAYSWVLSVFFRQLANTDDIAGIISETERMMDSPAIEEILLNTIDTLCIAMGKQPNERAITNAISLQKKLIEWNPRNSSYYGSLAITTFDLYKFKSISGVPGLELNLLLGEAEKYSTQAVSGLKKTEKPYFGEDIVRLQILNASGKFTETEALVLAELSQSTAMLSQQMIFGYRQELALAYVGQSKNELAEQEYRNLQKMDSENETIKELLANACITNRKFDDAQLLYQQLLMKNRDNARYVSQIGNIELLKGNYAEASFQIEKAIKLNPADQSFYGILAEAYDGAANFKKALENYKIAIQYQQEKLALIADRVQSNRELVQAQKIYFKYMARVGELNDQLGNYEESVKAYNKIIEADGLNAPAYYGLGKASLSSGLVYDAVNAFYSACKLDPSNQSYTTAHTNALSLREHISRNEPPLNILEVHVKDVFPSLYRNYADASLLSLGEIVIANNTSMPITPTSITVFCKELMTQPTQIKSPAIVGYSNAYVLITALFNENILESTNDKQLQLEVAIQYTQNREAKSIRKSSTFVLHGRNAISWSDKRRLAAFISPNINALIAYNQKGDQVFKEQPQFGLNKTILKAMQTYTLLNNSGFAYTPDPAQSFATVTTNTDILDNLQYPTETLKRKSGDCDDLVGVYTGLLENEGIAAAYVDVPGHVFMAFDCQLQPDEIKSSGLSEHDVIVSDEKVWIPVETTLIGTQNFMLAWKSAAARYYDEMSEGNFPEIVPLADARTVYVPSIFVPQGFVEEPPAGAEVVAEYNSSVSQFLTKTNENIMSEMESRYEIETGNVYVKNKYAALLAQAGEIEKAERILLEALDLSSGNAAVMNNLGNIYYLDGNAPKAIEYYEKASLTDTMDGEIMINLCKAHLLANNTTTAKKCFDKALSLNAELGYVYDYLNNQVK